MKNFQFLGCLTAVLVSLNSFGGVVRIGSEEDKFLECFDGVRSSSYVFNRDHRTGEFVIAAYTDKAVGFTVYTSSAIHDIRNGADVQSTEAEGANLEKLSSILVERLGEIYQKNLEEAVPLLDVKRDPRIVRAGIAAGKLLIENCSTVKGLMEKLQPKLEEHRLYIFLRK